MPSSWDIYYVVFLSALMALGIPVLLGICSYLVSSERKARGIDSPSNARISQMSRALPTKPATSLNNKRVNARFFLGMNAALVLIALALALIPCAGMLGKNPDRESFLMGLVAVISIAAFAGLGLLYSSVKGDLSWISSYQKKGEK